MFGKNLIQDFSTEFDPRWIWTNFEMAEVEKPPFFFRVHFERNYIDKSKIAYCLATSYEWTKKLILIDLLDEGFSEHILDVERPKIVASEHIANRYETESIYTIVVKLLDAKKNLISKNGLFEKTHRFNRAEIQKWLCIKHIFNCYPPGVRYISFESAGKATRDWMGPYGVKMARASIVILEEENNIMMENFKSFDLSNLPIIQRKYKNPPNKFLLCSSYLRWRLFFEYVLEHSYTEAHKNLCQLFGRPIVTIEQCYQYFGEFRAVGLAREDFLRTCNIEHAMLCYEASSNLDSKKTNHKILDTSSLRSSEDFYHLIGFLTTELASRTDGTVLHLDEHTTTIVTPLCLVSFQNGGHRWSFEIPTNFDPQRLINFEEPIVRIFDETCLLTKAIMHMGRRRMSLHEIICDIYECDPNNTWLSDEKLINLQLWDSHAQFGGPFFEWAQTWNGNSKAQMLENSISEHLLDYSKELHRSFYVQFSSHVLKNIGEPDLEYNRVWTTRECDWFANRLINKVNNKLLKHFNENQDLADAKFNILQRDIFLCGLYAFIENFMKVMLAALWKRKTPDEILSLYTKVWRTLMFVLDAIVKNIKEKFIEESPRQFQMIIKAGKRYWKRIWFNNESLPRLIKYLIDKSREKEIDFSHIITPAIVESYRTLGIYKDHLPRNHELTKMSYFTFMKWHMNKVCRPLVIPTEPNTEQEEDFI